MAARRAITWVAMIAVLICFQLPEPAPALAGGDSDCPHGGNDVAEACLLGMTHYGVYAEWSNEPMMVTDAAANTGAHVNHTLWTDAGINGCDRFVEIGLTRGFGSAPAAYGWYYGYRDVARGTMPALAFWIGNTSEDHSTSRYWLRYNSGDEYSILMDKNDGLGMQHLARFSGIGVGSCRSNAGMEEQTMKVGGFPEIPDANHVGSSTFHLVNLKYQTVPYDGSGYETFLANNTQLWPTNYQWIDFPCGQGFTYPNCFNGVHVSPSHWSDNHLINP